MLLVPSLGRDYKTSDEATRAYLAGNRFILKDLTSRWNGQPCSKRDFSGCIVEIRYNQRRFVTFVKTP